MDAADRELLETAQELLARTYVEGRHEVAPSHLLAEHVTARVLRPLRTPPALDRLPRSPDYAGMTDSGTVGPLAVGVIGAAADVVQFHVCKRRNVYESVVPGPQSRLRQSLIT